MEDLKCRITTLLEVCGFPSALTRLESLCENGAPVDQRQKNVDVVSLTAERCGVESVRLHRSAPGHAGKKIRAASIRRSHLGADGEPILPTLSILTTRHVKTATSADVCSHCLCLPAFFSIDHF